MAIKRRVDKGRWRMDAGMQSAWWSGYFPGEGLVEFFGGAEAARAFYRANEAKLRRFGVSEGWWEAFGPKDLRMSGCDVRDHYSVLAGADREPDCGCHRPDKFHGPDPRKESFNAELLEWLAVHHKDEWATM
jgi:hypothetical protein